MPERTVELRYEELVADTVSAADRVATALGAAPGPLRSAFSAAHAGSVGRWRRELSAQQVADVEAEAGGLLAELGYLYTRVRRYPADHGRAVSDRGNRCRRSLGASAHREAGYPRWSGSIGLRGGEATVSVPGHYPGVLADGCAPRRNGSFPAAASAATSTST